MDSFRDLIDQWPSVAVFAEDLGVSRNTASGWYRRNSVPAWYWNLLIAQALEREIPVTADELVELASRAA